MYLLPDIGFRHYSELTINRVIGIVIFHPLKWLFSFNHLLFICFLNWKRNSSLCNSFFKCSSSSNMFSFDKKFCITGICFFIESRILFTQGSNCCKLSSSPLSSSCNLWRCSLNLFHASIWNHIIHPFTAQLPQIST